MCGSHHEWFTCGNEGAGPRDRPAWKVIVRRKERERRLNRLSLARHTGCTSHTVILVLTVKSDRLYELSLVSCALSRWHVSNYMKLYVLFKKEKKPHVQILASGLTLRFALEASEKLMNFGLKANIWSITSFNELARGGIIADQENINKLHNKKSYVESCFSNGLPTVAVSEYQKLYSEMTQILIVIQMPRGGIITCFVEVRDSPNGIFGPCA